MIILSYDISDDKKRAAFCKFIKKFGYRLQYSVFRIDNSPRILNNIVLKIKNEFEKEFDETDSIYIFNLSKTCQITTFGYAAHEDADIIIV